MWIKIPIAEADKIHDISESMIVEGLNINVDRDIRDYLLYEVINDIVYVYTAIFDLKNKNRMYPSSEEEVAKWDAFITEHNWETVDEIPRLEVI